MTKKMIRIGAIAGIAALALTGCSGGGSSEDSLSVYAWEGEIPDEIVQNFEEETGIKVTVDNFDSNETMISKLASGNTGYDIVQPSQYAIQQLVGQELLEPLDHSKLEGMENLTDKFVDPSYDPGNEHALPWVWGTTGILYNSTCTGGEEITSWESLFDPKWKNKIYMLDNMLAAYIVGLQVNGYSADSTDEAEIEKATETLIDQKDILAGYNATNVEELITSGDACVAEAWAGTATATAVAENDDVHYVVPDEGGSLWVDSVAIAKGAPHEENAYKFLNYLLRPEVAAIATNASASAVANKAAQEFVTDQELLDNPAVFTPEDQIDNADFIVDPGEAMKFYQQGWTRVKSS